MKILISILAAGVIAVATGQISADQKRSAVQLAAAAKLIGKLGKLRGSVKPEDHSIFLTMDMVSPNDKPFKDITGGVPKISEGSKVPKLPPIVLEMGPKIDQLLEKILSGTMPMQAETKIEEMKPFNLQDALTLARAENSPQRQEQIVAFKKQAFNYLEDYFTPPARSE